MLTLSVLNYLVKNSFNIPNVLPHDATRPSPHQQYHLRYLIERSSKVIEILLTDGSWEFSICFEIWKCLCSTTTKKPAKFQSDISKYTSNLVNSRVSDILWYDVLSDIEMGIIRFIRMACWNISYLAQDLIAAWNMWMKFEIHNFQANITNWWLRYLLWNFLRWMSLDLTDDKPPLVQVMAWCHQATSHYLSQYWPRSLVVIWHH